MVTMTKGMYHSRSKKVWYLPWRFTHGTGRYHGILHALLPYVYNAYYIILDGRSRIAQVVVVSQGETECILTIEYAETTNE